MTLASLPGDGALTGDTRSCPPRASCVSGACLGSEAAGPTDSSLALTELTFWGGNVVMCKEEPFDILIDKDTEVIFQNQKL